MKKNSFVIYMDYEEKLSPLNDEELGKIFRAIFYYLRTETIPKNLSEKLKYVFNFIKVDIDKNNMKYQEKVERIRENAKSNKSKRKETNRNDMEQIESDSEDITNTYTNTNIIKNKYSELNNVLLTEEEYIKLNTRLKSKAKEYIEKLSLYIASTGKKYKSHYATILTWYRKDNPNLPEWFDQEIKKEEMTETEKIELKELLKEFEEEK